MASWTDAIAWLEERARIALEHAKPGWPRARLRRIEPRGRWWHAPPCSLLVAEDRDDWQAVAMPPGASEADLGPDAHPPRRPASMYAVFRVFPEAPVRLLQLLRLGGRSFGRLAVLLGGLILAAALMAMVVPVATAVLFDHVIPERDMGGLTMVMVAMVGGAILLSATELARANALLRALFAIDQVAHLALFDRLLRAESGFFRRFFAEDLATRLLDVSLIGWLVGPLVVTVLVSLGVFLASFGTMVWIDPALSLVALGLAVAMALATGWLTTVQASHDQKAAAREARLFQLVVEAVERLESVRAADAQGRLYSHAEALFTDTHTRYRRAQRAANLGVAIQAGFAILAPGVLFWTAGASADPPQLAAFLAFYAAFGQMLFGLLAIAGAATAATRVAAPLQRLRPLVEVSEEPSGPATVPVSDRPAELAVAGVSFRYAPDAPWALDDVSLTVRAGEVLALTGESGSGKSTLLRLLLRLDEPDAGVITLDGTSLIGIPPAALRPQLGVVMQDSPLFDGTIGANIAGFAPVERHQLGRAADLAGLGVVGPPLPQGLDTKVVRTGDLPGGLRQQVALARAFLRTPRLLLLDEATNVMDADVQRHVMTSIRSLGMTCLLVTHRLTAMGLADRVVMLEGGQVVDEGPFDEVLLGDGPFSRLFGG